MAGDIVPAWPDAIQPKLLGGSSKLAKLAEERRKKAAAASQQSNKSPANDHLNSLDRLSKSKDLAQSENLAPKPEVKRYVMRRKEPSPPPREPTPPPEVPLEEIPDLRSLPTEFGRTLSTSPSQARGRGNLDLRELLDGSPGVDPFQGLSPDDIVFRAQGNSKGLGK